MTQEFEYRPGIFLLNGYDPKTRAIADEQALLNLIDELQAWHGIQITARLAYQNRAWCMK